MSTEYGLFNDEGLVEGGFYSEETAKEALTSSYTEEDELHVARICSDHQEQEADNCEFCAEEEDEEETGL